MSPITGTRRLVLVGGGHAHLHVLERLARDGGWPGVDVTLISPPRHHYSGMLPGYLQGQYEEVELRFDLPALSRAAGVHFVPGLVRRVDGSRGKVHLEDGVIPFDHCSLDVGSAPRTGGAIGVEEHASSLRPTSRALELDRRLEALNPHASVGRDSSVGPDVSVGSATSKGSDASKGPAASVVVVGAGAAGFEVAVAVAVRGVGQVTLIEESPTLLPEYSERVRRRAQAVLARHGIAIRSSTRVVRVEAEKVVVTPAAPASSSAPAGEPPSTSASESSSTRVRESASTRARESSPMRVRESSPTPPGSLPADTSIPAQLTIWLAGAGPPPLLAASDLPLTRDGFFAVDPSLRSVDGAPVWGAGDCIGLEGYPWMPRAGVYAVRQAPVLARNLKAVLTGSPNLERYEPQSSFLSLLNTGGGRALLRWKGLVMEGRSAWWLKDWIDSRFMERVHKLAASTPNEDGTS